MSARGPAAGLRRRPPLRWVIGVAAGLLILAMGVWAAWQIRQASTARRLLALPPDAVLQHKDLVRFAVAEGRPLFAHNCAACHGADMKGLRGAGPNLTDKAWLYDDSVFAIERTVLFGIRSPNRKTRDVTEMPAYGLRGQLTDGEIRDVVQYVLQLSHQPFDAQAAIAGRVIFENKAVCQDCHGHDARGNTDYGAPDLTANAWIYGGDPTSLYNSIYYGHHGVMPAWIGKLSLSQIRALAVYVYVVSHPANPA